MATAFQLAAAQDIRDNAPTDLGSARTTDLVAKRDALETALRNFCDAVAAHNTRCATWRRQMGTAVAYEAADTVNYGTRTWRVTSEGVFLRDGSGNPKTYRPLEGGKLIGATLARVLASYDDSMRRFAGGTQLAPADEHVDSNGQINLTALIQKDA
ncbi:hypothetical protein ACWCQN_39930 [Streptomyces sp. NPDC001984]|uniref:hypothetical protein n=1 Tax=Streptomyces sp. NPDC002619 TaxID=3364655 RepID=UPI003687A97D